MGEPIILITGLPRSGTTLTTELLGGLADCVAIDEPIDLSSFMRDATPAPKRGARISHRLLRAPITPPNPNPERVADNIFDFCLEARRSAKTRGLVTSKNVEGSVTGAKVADTFEADRSRTKLARKSEIRVDKELSEDFTLFVKHNSAFAGVLPELVLRAPVLGVVRNPLAILASWNTVPFNVSRGHASMAERLEPSLARDLARLDDVSDRQFHLLNWFFMRFRESLPPELTVRYEDIVSSGGTALGVIHPAAASLKLPLASRNQAKVYDEAVMRAFGERLLATDGAYWSFYDRSDVLGLIPE
jgi:hypothetical protein